MAGEGPERLSFLVSWEEPQSGLSRLFTLLFHPAEAAVEMADARTGRTFLKKTVTAEVTAADLYLGNVLVLLARRLTVKDFGDEVTRRCTREVEATLATVMPGGLGQAGRLLAEAQVRSGKMGCGGGGKVG